MVPIEHAQTITICIEHAKTRTIHNEHAQTLMVLTEHAKTLIILSAPHIESTEQINYDILSMFTASITVGFSYSHFFLFLLSYCILLN